MFFPEVVIVEISAIEVHLYLMWIFFSSMNFLIIGIHIVNISNNIEILSKNYKNNLKLCLINLLELFSFFYSIIEIDVIPAWGALFPSLIWCCFLGITWTDLNNSNFFYTWIAMKNVFQKITVYLFPKNRYCRCQLGVPLFIIFFEDKVERAHQFHSAKKNQLILQNYRKQKTYCDCWTKRFLLNWPVPHLDM